MKHRLFILFPLFLIIGLCCFFAPTLGHEGDEKPVPRSSAKKDAPKKDQIQDLEGDRFVTRETSPVRMSATYYYGNADRETVPVLLLHGSGGSRADFAPFIDLLVKGGYAVLAVDLRGHGRSTKRLEREENTRPAQRSGKTTTKLVDYFADDFQPQDYIQMTNADLPLLRNALEQVHIAGMANLNRLVVVGIGRGAALAAYETTQSWKDRESGRFVKTLVMIAPTDLVTTGPTISKFLDNRLLRENVAVFTAVPQNDATCMEMVSKIRTVLLDKDAEKDSGDLKSKVPLYAYPATKTVRREGGDETVPMTTTEIFSNPTSNLGPILFKFINDRNQGFKSTEHRWSRLK